MTIAYDETKIKKITVFVDGIVTGHIVKVLNGYQYVVKGNKYKGEVFKSVYEVKQSIEEESNE